jgi:beta-glucosidase-like glycosyl hydrolase/CubicO group peptidase (beta-lactamase class C family)
MSRSKIIPIKIRDRRKEDPSAAPWVKQTLGRMPLEEKLGQLLMVPFFGGFKSTESADYEELFRSVEEQHVGGFMLATRVAPQGIVLSQVYPTAALANQLQRHARIPLLFGADFEHGTAMRLAEGTSFPHAMAVAAAGSPQYAYEVGRVTALEARAAGIHWIFAPDADVNSNPANPIINTRSFGEDPERVAEFVCAFVRGVEENGGLATAKHFPGHGDTITDSHLGLPQVTADRARLEKVELLPFRAAISAGVSSVMTGHLAVPALESDAEVPATLSHAVLSLLLRKTMGFHGLVVTDALDMAGAADRSSSGEVAVRAILAGADVLLIPPAPDSVLAALYEAVASKRLSLSRVDESVARILHAKARLGLHKTRLVSVEKLNQTFAKSEYASIADKIAARGISLLGDGPGLVPQDASRAQRILLVAIAGDPDIYPAETFEREIRWRVDSLAVVRADTRFAPAALAQLPSPDSYDVAVAAIFVRVADRKGSIGLPAQQVELVEKLFAQGKPVIAVGFGSPYVVERFPQAQTWLAAFSTAEVAQRAAARALFGEIGISGKLPVSVPGAKPPLRAGDGIARDANPMRLRAAGPDRGTRLMLACDLLDGFVGENAFPGGVIAVGCQGELWLHPFGRQTFKRKAAPVTKDTIYDVASLTKPVVTTTLVAMEVEAGNLKLDAPVGAYLQEWDAGPLPEWRRRVTLRHLLTHSSGLPGHVPYYETSKSQRETLAHVLAEPLINEPGSKVEYSDPGFILLGEIIERGTGRPLNELAQQRILAPLGMHDTLWNPPHPLHKRIAPSGDDSPIQRGPLWGEAHDDNAWAMGGVAGHAGLFSTAGDLAVFCQMMLNGGIYAHRRLLCRSTIEQFTAPQPLAHNTRALGWVVPTEPSASGKYFSPRSFGHSGYTGTSIWCDPEKEVFVVLLTNRTHPTRTNEKVQKVRPAIHDAVMEALGFAKARSSARHQ